MKRVLAHIIPPRFDWIARSILEEHPRLSQEQLAIELGKVWESGHECGHGCPGPDPRERVKARAKRYAFLDGRGYEIFVPAVVGEGPCPGAAHDNPLIDHCLRCAPRWGIVDTYAEIDVVAEVARGYAVRVCDASDTFELKAGDPIDMVAMTEKTRSGTSNYMAYVAKVAP